MEERFFICPWCWQSVSILIDTGEEAMEWIEDCEVCCNPILFSVKKGGEEIGKFDCERAQ